MVLEIFENRWRVQKYDFREVMGLDFWWWWRWSCSLI